MLFRDLNNNYYLYYCIIVIYNIYVSKVLCSCENVSIL